MGQVTTFDATRITLQLTAGELARIIDALRAAGDPRAAEWQLAARLQAILNGH